jgi:hypothetical protein
MFATIAGVVFVNNAQQGVYLTADIRKSMCSLGVAIFRVMPVYENLLFPVIMLHILFLELVRSFL